MYGLAVIKFDALESVNHKCLPGSIDQGGAGERMDEWRLALWGCV